MQEEVKEHSNSADIALGRFGREAASSAGSSSQAQVRALGASQPHTEAAQGLPAQSQTSRNSTAQQHLDSTAPHEAVSGHLQGAGTHGAPGDTSMRSSTGAEQLMLSRGTSVPGHSWLPYPRLATPDAAESDYLTVMNRPSFLPVHLQALTRACCARQAPGRS